MRKQSILIVTALLFSFKVLVAQNINDGIKLLNYEKNKSAKALFEKLYNANSKDPKTVYWYGQSFIENNDLTGAKAIYQKALQEGVGDALIIVGMGQLEILEGGNINAAKQKFEQAITQVGDNKGKNKGRLAEVLNAIGHANASGGLKFGDATYGVDKLKQAEKLDATNPDILINEGICYIKMGSDNGGDAVKSFEEALNRDPKNALAKYRIGRIYLSQNNKEMIDKYFNEVIALDPTFPPVYLSLFDYYSDKDVNKAKDYLNKFITYADADPNNEFYLAYYLFRAGKYSESLEKAKAIEKAVPNNSLPRLNILFAYDYNRLNDSIQAKSYTEKFFVAAPQEKIIPDDYELAVKVFSKFPNSETQIVNYLQKAIESDSTKAHQLNFMMQAADVYGKSKNYVEQLKWLQKATQLKGDTLELDFYKMATAALGAKDCFTALNISKSYLTKFPDKSQPYSFLRRAAICSDPDTTKGTAIEPLNFLISYLEKDTAKNKKAIFNNYYYMLLFYGDKTKDYPKAIEVLDRMLVLYPTPGEENKFALDQKEMITKVMNRSTKPTEKPKAAAKPANGTPAKK